MFGCVTVWAGRSHRPDKGQERSEDTLGSTTSMGNRQSPIGGIKKARRRYKLYMLAA